MDTSHNKINNIDGCRDHVSIGSNDAGVVGVSVGDHPGGGVEDEDDIDEDLLYMRLKALQSLRDKLDRETELSFNNAEAEESDEMVDEMEELLQEADQAANEADSDYLEVIPTEPTAVIDDLDEAGMDAVMKSALDGDNVENYNVNDNMSELVRRLKEAAKKTRIGVLEDLQVNYSPTQSPIREIEAISVASGSPLNSVSPAESAAEEEETATKKEVIDMEIDMEVTTEAEIQFFKHQKEEPLFPPSVWEFKKSPTPPSPPPKIVQTEDVVKASEDEAKLEAYHQAVLAHTLRSSAGQKMRRKRTRSQRKSQSMVEKPPTTIEDAEDESVLRAALLSSMAAKKARNEPDIVLESIALEKEPKKPQEIITRLPQQTQPQMEIKMKKQILVAKKMSPKKALMTKKQILVKQRKMANDLERLKKELDNLQDKSIKNKAKAMPLSRKSFPNLFKPVIIPRCDLEPSDDDERPLKVTSTETVNFNASLDTLMKNLRSQTTLKAKLAKPAKPVRKFTPAKPVRKFPPKAVSSTILTSAAAASKAALLSSADKENLKHSNISSLPRDKQTEYKNLLELLAQKEAAKAAAKVHNPESTMRQNLLKDLQKKKKSSPSSKQPPINIKVSISNKNEDRNVEVNIETKVVTDKVEPHTPLKSILKPSKPVETEKLTTEIQKVKITGLEVKNTGNEAKTSAVKTSQNTKNSHFKAKGFASEVKKSAFEAKKIVYEAPKNTELEATEAKLVSFRKEMCGSLFKLSAEVSQLKEETKKKVNAELFLAKLKSQIAMTEDLISKKDERVVGLKKVVRQSHKDIVIKSKVMSGLKKECKTLGVQVQGANYEPPTEGMSTIRKKLNVINNSARRIPNKEEESEDSSGSSSESGTSSESESSDDTSSDEDSSDDDGEKEVNHLPNSSALAHLNQVTDGAKIDPHVEFCIFDLKGRCNDPTCPYQHHRPA